MKQWPADVNSCFAEVTEDDILRMQDITISNDTKKATDHPSFADAPLPEQQLSFHGSISKSHPSQLNFH